MTRVEKDTAESVDKLFRKLCKAIFHPDCIYCLSDNCLAGDCPKERGTK